MCTGTRSVLGEVAVLEAEVALLALAPRALPVEVDVHALLVLLRDRLRLRVPLEPRQVLDVESPRLTLELLGGKVPTKLSSECSINRSTRGEVRTVGMCPGGSRTRKRASRRRAARRCLASSGWGSAPAGSSTAFGWGSGARSTWACKHNTISISTHVKRARLTSPYPGAAACSSSCPAGACGPGRGWTSGAALRRETLSTCSSAR